MEESIAAYRVPERVRGYDRDMDLFHPNRHRMARIALEVLPFASREPLRVLDLGAGTGFLTARFLARFPRSWVLAVDGSGEMLDLARERLGDDAGRADLREARLEEIASILPESARFDVVVSSHALHHLTREAKSALTRALVDRLSDGGWFVNADLVAMERAEMRERSREVRIERILAHARPDETRFCDTESLRAFLESLSRNESDRPLPLQDELEILRSAGLENASVLWQEFDEAVWGGFCPVGGSR